MYTVVAPLLADMQKRSCGHFRTAIGDRPSFSILSSIVALFNKSRCIILKRYAGFFCPTHWRARDFPSRRHCPIFFPLVPFFQRYMPLPRPGKRTGSDTYHRHDQQIIILHRLPRSGTHGHRCGSAASLPDSWSRPALSLHCRWESPAFPRSGFRTSWSAMRRALSGRL